ncbi:helix-turn-helix domain-containing protein [Rahnella woolbedingensis]|uniref:IprA winged helix-turn-helix domain-containing protein n=1 Tax=Rahnella woolbedingensis TaxID=1510574 RepID=A0A419ND65_9GAMM|nr:helix-turn-helix domain-containing protein [Rahnella woolbedingensis]RJT46413.1 hypothetical protein D6C13_04115 [Rahnella woolbedingensis]
MRFRKPAHTIQILVDICEPVAQVLEFEAGKRLALSQAEENVIFLAQGGIQLYRRQDDLLISEIVAPYAFGIMHNRIESDYYYIKATGPTKFLTLPYDDFMKIAREHDLWETLFIVATHTVTYLIRRDVNLINRDRYNIVKSYLQDLNELPDEKKSKMTVTQYIVRRSGLSRSGVMGILSELKKGGYIVLKDGYLEYLADNIPNEF